MQRRYHDPVAGRFLSVDPVMTDANTGSSFNRYAYANNSPYKYIDQDGRGAVTVEGCRVACTGVTLGSSKGELALTINIGVGGGVSVDPRPDQNGRINDPVGSAGKGTKPSNVGTWTDVTAVPSSRNNSDRVASVGRTFLGTTATSGADSAQKQTTSHGDFDGMMSKSGSQQKVDASY